MSAGALLTALAGLAAPWIPLAFSHQAGLEQARDRWLTALLFVAIAPLSAWSPWLGLVAVWWAWRWPVLVATAATDRQHMVRVTQPLLLWAALGATWALVLTIPPVAWDSVRYGWVVAGCYQVGLMTHRAWTGQGEKGWTRWAGFRCRQRGTVGTSAMTALLLALLTPLAPWWLWPVFAWGLWLTCSYAALLALLVGFWWLFGASTWVWVGSGLVGAFAGLTLAWRPVVWGRPVGEWTPRGDTTRTWGQRWHVLEALWAGRSWTGAGPASTGPYLNAWGARYRVSMPTGEAFNDIGQMAYEYGPIGLGIMVVFAWPICARLTLGDPYSAAWLTGCVLACFHWPMRLPSTGLLWLAISGKVVSG